MKKLNFFLLFISITFVSSVFAQRSTFFDGTYVMNRGNQTVKIVTEGGKYYRVTFSGNCYLSSRKGEVVSGALMVPMTNDKLGDYIRIDKNGDKIEVDVNNEARMDKMCNGGTMIGTYYLKNSYGNNDRNYDLQYERDFKSPVNVNDLRGMDAVEAYEELMSRGFEKRKKKTYGGTTYGVWYNRDTHQCIKTVSKNKRITDIMKSTHCFN